MEYKGAEKRAQSTGGGGSEWAMKVNADKCGVMRIRRNGVKRTTSIFSVDGERVNVMESYKFLGCIVNEHVDCRNGERKGYSGERCTECLAMNVYVE